MSAVRIQVLEVWVGAVAGWRVSGFGWGLGGLMLLWRRGFAIQGLGRGVQGLGFRALGFEFSGLGLVALQPGA